MQLNKYVQEVSLEDFGKPFRHEAHWNKRLKTTGGRFFPLDGHLDFNYNLYQEFGQEVFRKIVRHELCHYHLYFENKGYQHGQKDFKDLLKKVDGLRYAPSSKQKRPQLVYVCCKCQHLFYRKRRLDTSKYVCGICKGKLLERNQSQG
ncbi:SprT family protein [Streptococcus didelphis]|uniref:SprT family protein n=1 Tax=Streptococcus didelphis TaxID=102886 RepID=UPI000365BAFB|nr:SprT family protein [Streptococcus didelphis]WMB29133.1 SprT family protein [Streptococcus didelphis]